MAGRFGRNMKISTSVVLRESPVLRGVSRPRTFGTPGLPSPSSFKLLPAGHSAVRGSPDPAHLRRTVLGSPDPAHLGQSFVADGRFKNQTFGRQMCGVGRPAHSPGPRTAHQRVSITQMRHNTDSETLTGEPFPRWLSVSRPVVQSRFSPRRRFALVRILGRFAISIRPRLPSNLCHQNSLSMEYRSNRRP